MKPWSSCTQVSELGSMDIHYVHDALGRRIGKLRDGNLEKGWLYADALNPIAQLDSAGNVEATFVYGTRAHVPDSMVMSNGTVYRLITDHLGSVRLVVNAATGTVAQRIDYDAFGRVLNDTSPGFQPFGFAGGLYDDDTGLVRFGARDYDAYAGRWTAKDPILFLGRSGNLYGYVGDDPINRIDPTGLLNPIKFWVGAINAYRGVLGIASGVSAATVAALMPGASPGIAAASVQAALGIGAFRRGVLQLQESWNESLSDASFRNVLGLLPAGQKYDDPVEPTLIEYLEYLYTQATCDPLGTAAQFLRDMFVIDD